MATVQTTKDADKGLKAKDLIHGYDASKIDGPAVDDALARLKIEVPKKADLTKRVGSLKTFFEAQDAKDLVDCDSCDAASLSTLDWCPFCGLDDKGAYAVPTGQIAKHTNGLVTTTDLDRQIAEVRTILSEGGMVSYKLAMKVAEIEQTQSWKTRLKEDGVTPLYKKFDHFTQAEIGISKKYAVDLLKIHARFSKEDVARVGVTKLRLIATLPEEQQGEVLERVKKGGIKGKRQLAKETSRKPDKSEKKAAPDKGKTITIAAIEGKRTVKMYVKPASRNVVEADMKPAKRMADAPYGWMDLTNDTRISFTLLHNAAGEMVMRVMIHRVDAQE
jgi:hypothetical protein